MSKTEILKQGLLLFGVSVWASCVPSHLAKYQGRQGVEPTAYQKEPASNQSNPRAEAKLPEDKAQKQATIFAVDNQTFKLMLRGDKVWEAAIDILLRNYNLTIVDRESGVITTEWDSFFMEGKVYRNRVSLRVRRISPDQTELTVLNNVESLTDNGGVVSNIWLPAEDKAGETARIVQNLALVLKEPPPVLPPGMVARAVDPAVQSEIIK